MFLAQKKTAKRANNNIVQKLFSLLQGKKEPAKIDSNVVYRELVEKPENKQLQSDGTYIAYISIPNSEISSVYKKEIMDSIIALINCKTRIETNETDLKLIKNIN